MFRRGRAGGSTARGLRWFLTGGALIGLLCGSMAPLVGQSAAGTQESAVRVEKRLEVTPGGEGPQERRVVVLRKSAEVSATEGDAQTATQVFVLSSPGATAREFEVRTRIDGGYSGSPDAESVNVFEWVHSAPSPTGGFLGVEILPLTDALRDHFASPRGVGVLISDVQEASPARLADLRAGDVLTRIDGQAVSSTHGFGRLMRRMPAGHRVGIELWREGNSRHVEATLEEREHHVLEFGSDGRIVRFEGSLEEDVYFDVEGAATEIREVLSSGEWKAKVEDLRAIDVDALERRILQLEREIDELRRRGAPPDG